MNPIKKDVEHVLLDDPLPFKIIHTNTVLLL